MQPQPVRDSKRRPGHLPHPLKMMAVIALSLASAGTLVDVSWGQQDAAEIEVRDEPIELSLRTLFHPNDKHDFDGELPSTHWVGDNPSILMVRRPESWGQVDLESGKEIASSVVEQLAERLENLEGIQAGQAAEAAMAAVAKLENLSDSVLVNIGSALALVSTDERARWLTRDGKKWKNATLDPTARRVAYTSDGDLFVVDTKTGRTLRLSNDGLDTMLDGVLDWTYQEEIFGRGNYKGFWFSPDGEWLAMLRIDISGIEPYVLSSASSERGSGVVRRYTKAGDPIPQAELYLWDLREFDAGNVPPAKLIEASTPQRERLITGVWWHPLKMNLLYTVSDRSQTWRELRLVEQPLLAGVTSDSTLLVREESPAWVEPPIAPGWLADGGLVWRSELPSGRSRLYRVSANGAIVDPITPENFDVRLFSVPSSGSLVLVTGDTERGTIEQHAYRIELTDGQPPTPMDPITNQPGWHAVEFSPDGKWLVDVYSTPSRPPSLIVRSTSDDRHFGIAETSLRLQEAMTEPQVFQIPTTDGLKLPALLVRPPSASETDRCPVVIEVYGGPQTPVVSTRWAGTKSLYRELLARRGIATLVVDNRSSAGRGIADSWVIRHRVGEVELQDLLTSVDWLKDQPWVDADRLALRGWSFGGFLTLYAMTHSEVFIAGIAGGSVTDWREYDSLYTERYMGTPSENPQGYASSAPVAAAEKLHGSLMLIHGEEDDNVHPSNTMRMAAALQQAGKQFRLMLYPGAAHAITDPKQQWHLAQMIDQFLEQSLRPQSGER